MSICINGQSLESRSAIKQRGSMCVGLVGDPVSFSVENDRTCYRMNGLTSFVQKELVKFLRIKLQ